MNSPEFGAHVAVDPYLPFRPGLRAARRPARRPRDSCASSRSASVAACRAFQIRRRRADHAVVGRDVPRDERGISKLADADGEVEAFADDVDERVGQMDVELDLGIAGEEVVDVRRDVQPAERSSAW